VSAVAYLIDENVPVAVVAAVRVAEPSVSIAHVGMDSRVPPNGT